MRRILSLLLAFTCGPWLPAIAQPSDEEALRAELDHVWKALASGDADYFRTHYVSEVSRFHLEGTLDIGWDEDKADALQTFFDRGWRIKTRRYEVDDLRVYGDIAIVAGTGEGTELSADGSAEEVRWRFTYVWIKKDDRWLELHHHVSAPPF